MKLPNTSQRETFDCGIACKQSVDKYFGNPNQQTINSKYFKIAMKNNGLTSRDMLTMYKEGGYKGKIFSGNFSKEKALKWMINEMKANHAVQISAQISNSSQYHASLIKGVKYLADFSKFRISLMNPSTSIINANNFNSYNSMFSIWK